MESWLWGNQRKLEAQKRLCSHGERVLGGRREDRGEREGTKELKEGRKRGERGGTDGEKCGSDELLLSVLRWCNCIKWWCERV